MIKLSPSFLYKNDVCFGSYDIANAVKLRLVGSLDIYEIITSRDNLTFYVVLQKCSDGGYVADVIGKNKNKFLKYVGDESFFHPNGSHLISNLGQVCALDTDEGSVVFLCSDWRKISSWKFTSAWDDSVDFFDVKYSSI